MNLRQSRYYGFISVLFWVVCAAQAPGALATSIGIDGTLPDSAALRDSPAAVRAAAGTRPAPLGLATQSPNAKPRSSGAARGSVAKSAAGLSGGEESGTAAGGRGTRPVHTATANTADPEQPGYVHYFLLTLPDESLETLVGIEMPGRKIAWSFPDLGVVVAPLADKSVVPAGGKEYGVSHLYGIRPFPDEAAMNALRGELAGRVGSWVAAGTPYCDNDGPRSTCMSCLGFVLRVLFPGKQTAYPALPKDFWRAMYEKSYSTEDLLLYLTGMLDLPNREARLKRVSQLDLPEALRADVQELVETMDASGSAPPASASQAAAAPKRPSARPGDISSQPVQRKRL